MTTGRSTPELVPYNFGASDEKHCAQKYPVSTSLDAVYSSNCWGTPTDIKLLKNLVWKSHHRQSGQLTTNP